MKKRLGSIKDRSSKEAAATREALAFAKNRGAEKVAVFLSFGDEISTDGLIGGLLSGGATVCAPITDGNGMVFVKIKNDTKYSAGAFGIRIPEYSDAVTDFDIVFTPLLAVDASRSRLGRGKGYYDRFLRTSKAKKVGFCFDAQRVETVPTEDFDVPLDAVITESGIY
jgi:5-formyltetrahydrofolate cyclo-ligase